MALVNCIICNVTEEADEVHRASPIHRFNYSLYEFNMAKKSLVNNRHGVDLDISPVELNGFQNNFPVKYDKRGCYHLKITPELLKKYNQQIEFKCKITNTRTARGDSITITYAGIAHPHNSFSMEDLQKNGPDSYVILSAGASYQLIAKFKLSEICISTFKMPVYFSIQTVNKNEQEMKQFSIARSIIIDITEDSVPDIITKSPFTNKPFEAENVIAPQKWIPVYDNFRIPSNYNCAIFSALKFDGHNGTMQEIRQKLSAGEVTEENYEDFFHILLWLEEACDIIGLSCFNMENVHLVYIGDKIVQLEVPGLAEKRPSIIRGDLIEIKPHGDHTSYQGVIESITDNTVEIHYLHDEIIEIIQTMPTLEMDVHFILGRIVFERMHCAVRNIVLKHYESNLFPDVTLMYRNVRERYHLTREMLFNKKIYQNQEQFTAVVKILNNTSKNAPYIVYGPPGTGKSVTIVEAMYQLKQRFKGKILVCAATNATCDMLTQRLSAFCKTSELKRILSENYDARLVPKDVRAYCNLDVDGNYVRVPRNDVNNYKIIVTTLILAGKFEGTYEPDIIFIDEAAQPREPETAIAIALLKSEGQVILAGDPNQLGPSVRSAICRKYGYDVSMLERLMKLPLYQEDRRNDFITMLRQNFRSHADIIKISNEIFYDNKLEAKNAIAQNDPLSKVCVYDYIFRNKKKGGARIGTAVEFCSVIALESREGMSPSYFNQKEVQMVLKYIETLISLQFQKKSDNLLPSQIGIITPYIRQVYKLRGRLAQKFPDVEVGTTEAFQGREKRVIIISTVRGQEDLLLYDKKYKLGFVSEPKRFNVALTRAQSKCIIVGNPLVLSTDPLWTKTIKTSTFCGTPFQERNEALRAEISRRNKKILIKDLNLKQDG